MSRFGVRLLLMCYMLGYFGMAQLKDVAVVANPVLLELFTSQGCSSCPPADVLLQKTAENYPDVVFALSYHVDYWDYIGWEDPFGKASHTTKQSAYNRKFKYRSNYTPELVVNGKAHMVGSSKQHVEAVLKKRVEFGPVRSLNFQKVDWAKDKVTISLEENTKIKGNLRVALYLKEAVTVVKAGENRSRRLKNFNVVINEADFGEQSQGLSLTIPEKYSGQGLGVMLILENDNHDILGLGKALAPF